VYRDEKTASTVPRAALRRRDHPALRSLVSAYGGGENSDGCFTRAYIRAAFSEGAAERKIWGALLSLMASKGQVGWVWDNWLSDRLKRHSKTDSRIELRVVRLAADGVWLERIMNAKAKNLKGVEEYLIEMTRVR